MMKNIIFCDIDGTIVDGSRGLLNPSKKTKYAFEQLCKDNYVFIASGRCKGLLPKNIIDLKPNGYILCNGAYGEVENNIVISQCFDKKAIEKIIEVSLKYNGFYVLETINDMYVNSNKAEAFIKFLNSWGTSLKDFEVKEGFSKDYHIAMIGFQNENDCKNAEKELGNYVFLARHPHFMSYDCNILGIDKGYAAKKMIEYLDIDYENTYCFGDGINDLEMLQAVKHPVIVDNCVEELKHYGFEKTDDVLWDGFYNYLVNNKLIKPM